METIGTPTNGGKATVELCIPYRIRVTLRGTEDLLFHTWNCEAVEEKSKATKGSEAKKTDDLESYVERNDEGIICVPSCYVRMSMIGAAKFMQDPRSPRKSAQDLYKAGIVTLDKLCPLINAVGESPKIWDYVDKQRVQVQRNAITRQRPAFKAGYRFTVDLVCILPEYISPDNVHDTISRAGKLIGIGDYRPTYGRFRIDNFEVLGNV